VSFIPFLRPIGLTLAALLLSACAGTVKQDPRVSGDISRAMGIAQVSVQMSPDATRQQADNNQFNREELANFLRRRLETKGLISATASHKVDIVVTDIRVRSAIAAVMLGFMAGDDHVNGTVRLLGPNGQPLRSFVTNASYALGGIGGGQDGTRMNWLYDKFSELASAELEKVIAAPATTGQGSGAAPAPAGTPTSALASTPTPLAAPAAAFVIPPANPALRIDDVASVPGLNSRGREVYQDWLTHKGPRAFVIAEQGWFMGTWGTAPPDPTESRDPAERAMKRCLDRGRKACKFYAVNNDVVYVP
jgi:hypothetical protein